MRITTDGMLGKEAKKFVARLVDRLAGKWMSPYSQVVGEYRWQSSEGHHDESEAQEHPSA